MNDDKEPLEHQAASRRDESPTPDDLVHMYGGFLFFVAVPVIMVLIIIYLLIIY